MDPEFAAVTADLQRRWPEHRIEPTLDRVRRLTDLLGDPQSSYPVIHLTGTNGKTTTARMIDALLATAGLRTGRFTSPHLERVTERICLDGEPIGEQRFLAGWRDIEPYVNVVDSEVDPPLTFFETMTGLAYAMFADAPVAVAIVEVGLGGTWDATNVADGAVAVFTPVGIDHAHLLGNDELTIATEKAGIIKPGATAVIAPQLPEVTELLLTRCAELGATPVVAGRDFGVSDREVAIGGQLLTLDGLTGRYDEVFLGLHGEYQATNASVALAAVESFLGGERQLDPDLVREAFAAVSSPGRLEVVRRSPTILLDAAHNPHGARAAAAAVGESFSFAPLVGVVGCMGDKDVNGVLEAFEPVLDVIVCTQNSTPRAMPADELAEVALDVFGDEDRVVTVPRLDDAIERAVTLAEERETSLGSGGVLVTGSVVTAGEARTLLGGDRAIAAMRADAAAAELAADS